MAEIEEPTAIRIPKTSEEIWSMVQGFVEECDFAGFVCAVVFEERCGDGNSETSTQYNFVGGESMAIGLVEKFKARLLFGFAEPAHDD